MRFAARGRAASWTVAAMWCLLAGAGAGTAAVAAPPQASPTPTPTPPSPAPAPAVGPDGAGGAPEVLARLRAMEQRNRELEARYGAIEEQNRRLTEELQRTRAEQADQFRAILDRLEGRPGGPVAPAAAAGADGPLPPAPPPTPAPSPLLPLLDDAPRDTVDADTPVPDYTEGQFAPYAPAPGYSYPPRRPGGRQALGGTFGPGFRFSTEDEEFRLQIHYESQIEGRVWGQDQVPANSGIYLPRQRIFFSGNITRPIEYELAINRGFGSLNVLNAFVNLHLDDRFQFRIGRFFTPMLYDQYAISNYWLPTPERSIFTTNLSLNRQYGAMAWGYLLDKRLDYAAGVFNGSRNSFEPVANGLDFVGYLNARPFQESEALPWLRFLNVGTSVAYGDQDQAPVPASFRIAGGSPSADVPGPATTPFLILDRGVIERGDRLLGSVHAAYYHKSLSLIGEWQYGYGGYVAPGAQRSTRVPFRGYYVSAGYFLTGEQVERRTRVTPLRPFLTTRADQGRRGPGAWEAVARYSVLGLGDDVFTAGLADPALWSNQAATTELGLNWYWNDYIKIYMFWLRGDFADPVQYRPGQFQQTADMFWLRFQLYF